jgi:hypothetical protein
MQASPVSSKILPRSLAGFNANLHYSNPERKSGRTDKSAFRLYYTTVPRENVLDVFSPLIMSVEPVVRLAAGTRQLYWLYCVAKCTALQYVGRAGRALCCNFVLRRTWCTVLQRVGRSDHALLRG